MSEQPSITAAELSGRVSGLLEGDGTIVIRYVATLENAGADSISWAGSAKFVEKICGSKAGVVLVPQDSKPPAGRTVIRVADPDAALCDVLEALAPPTESVPVGVHSTATVSEGAAVEGVSIGASAFVGSRATIAAGTQIHPGVYVGADAKIGRDCVLWPNVVIRERVVLGDRVMIHPNTTIGADGFGYHQQSGTHRKIPQIGTVIIEDDVEIGANAAVDRARSGVTRIGRGTKIDNLVQIGHNVVIGEHCMIIAGVGIGGSAVLGHHVILAGHSGVADHCHIGDGARIAAKSVAFRNLTDGETVRGIPATDNYAFLREQASLRKLPAKIKELRDLAARVAKLEEEAR